MAWGLGGLLKRWQVVVAAHTVARWDVPARTTVVGAETAEHARVTVLRWAHADAGVPPLRSMLRAAWQHVRAERYMDANDEKVERMREREARRVSR